jgi:hypothetical protein
LEEKGQTRAVQQTVVDAIAQLPQLTELTLSFKDCSGPSLSLRPLLRLQQLTRFTLRGMYELAPEECSVLKQMSSLRFLSLNRGGWEDGQLEALCEEPHQLQRLEELNLGNSILRAEDMVLLQRLPGLTALEPDSMSPSCLPFLSSSSFPALRRLSIIDDAMEPEWGAEDIPPLLAALSRCPVLTDLYMAGLAHLSSADTATIARALPQLRKLELSGMDGLRSLRFLPLLPQLEELSLMFGDLEAKDLRAVLRLPRLRRLQLHDCMGLDSLTRALLTPPSRLLPTLTDFDYLPPEW